jgi:hypothetical protein
MFQFSEIGATWWESFADVRSLFIVEGESKYTSRTQTSIAEGCSSVVQAFTKEYSSPHTPLLLLLA